jgi:hypothetical protein
MVTNRSNVKSFIFGIKSFIFVGAECGPDTDQ